MSIPNSASVLHTRKPDWQRVNQISDLVAIFAPDTQVCACPREIDPAIAAYLARLSDDQPFQAVETLCADNRPQFAGLVEGPGKSALIDDLSLLADIIRELLDCPQIGMRIARIGHAMCPGWHMDHTSIRLVCTYHGPGTEWLHDQNVDRDALQSPHMTASETARAGTGEIVLLKGSIWQDNEGFGAIHRSPEVPRSAGLRTVVTVDPLWES